MLQAEDGAICVAPLAGAANFPMLLAAINISLQLDLFFQPELPRLQSLCSWLSSCAAAHVVRLRLDLRFDWAATTTTRQGRCSHCCRPHWRAAAS
jgi:hypothetical protein